MYFAKKRYVLEGFDGKGILSVQLDYPKDGEGFRYEYLSKLVDKCSNFVSEKLCDAVKSKYLSGYSVHARFVRHFYELRIVETYSDDELYSYLISVILKCGTGILSQEICSVVFSSDMIIPPKLISRGKYKAVFLDEYGIPANAEFHDGQIVTKKISNKQFSL